MTATGQKTHARFRVEFEGYAPDGAKVGDELEIRGKATIARIDGDLIDITSLGSDPKYTLGAVYVDLYSNAIEVIGE